MKVWYRWISPWHTRLWHESKVVTKEEFQDILSRYMDPLEYGIPGTMYEITDIDPPMNERFVQEREDQ